MNAGKNCIILHSVRTQKPYSDKFCSENLTKYINKLINYWSSIPLSIRVQSVVTKLMATQRGTKLHWTKNEPPYFVKKHAQYEAILSTTILLLDVSLYARSQNIEKQLSAVSCVSLRPLVSPFFRSHWTSWLPLDGYSWKLTFGNFSKVSREN